MSSEAAFEVVPMVGNTHVGQRALGTRWFRWLNTYPDTELESCGLGGETRVRANYASEGCMCTSA